MPLLTVVIGEGQGPDQELRQALVLGHGALRMMAGTEERGKEGTRDHLGGWNRLCYTWEDW